MAFKQLSLLSFLFCSVFSFAQNNQDLAPCGTKDGKVEWLKHYQQHPESHLRSMEDTLYVPLTIHLVANDNGLGHFPIRSLFDSFCTLNKDFAPSNIQFYIKGNIRYIYNTRYNDHSWEDGAEMMELYGVPRTINCYIVESPAGNCGYSAYDSGIALAKSCTSANSHTWAHEVGHYLSLPHPFFGWEGYEHDYDTPAPDFINGYRVERMDKAFCTQAGDGFCDTQPDYLNYRFQCSNDSLSIETQITPDSVEFRTDGSLFMSYSFNNCGGRFSDDQIAAMRANILTEKADFLDQDQPLAPLFANPLTIISPEEGSYTDTYQEVLFEWQALEGATEVQLEISPVSSFSFVLFKYDVTEVNRLLVTDLLPDKTYYWRLRGYNGWNTCDIFSDKFSFTVGNVTSISNLPTLEGIKIAPNPIKNGEQLDIQTDLSENIEIEGKLLTLTGVQVQRFKWKSGVGQQHQFLPTVGWSEGIYFLHLQSTQGVWSKKILVLK